jgi:Ca2+-binding RTX toxin-like protein
MPVGNADFRINDIDGSSRVTVRAYDADGNEIPVTLTVGDELTMLGDNTVRTKDLGEYDDPDDDDFSARVQIDGPVSRIEINHSEGDFNSGIRVTDVYFDAPLADTGAAGHDTLHGGEGDDIIYGEGGDDSITGGDGGDRLSGGEGTNTLRGGDGDDTIFGQDDDDTIHGGGGADSIDAGIDDDEVFGGADADTILGGQGDDTISGGAGADSMSGGDGRDTFLIGSVRDADGDTADGGSGGDDFDTLDLSGAGPFVRVGETTDADGDSTSGTINFLDSPSGTVTGTLTYSEIENIVPCFTPGTRIATPRGEVPVEELREGDRAITRDNGLQEVRWVGGRARSARRTSWRHRICGRWYPRGCARPRPARA